MTKVDCHPFTLSRNRTRGGGGLGKMTSWLIKDLYLAMEVE